MSIFIASLLKLLFLFSYEEVKFFVSNDVFIDLEVTTTAYILFHLAFWTFVAIGFNFFYRLLKYLFKFLF